MSTERDRFTFFASYYDAISDLNDADQLTMFRAICQYALTGEVPKLDGVLSTIFKLILPVLNTGKKRAVAGKTGGEADTKNKQTASKSKANRKQNESKSKANKKQNESKSEAKDKQTASDMEQEQEQEQDMDVCVDTPRARAREDTPGTPDTQDPPDGSSSRPSAKANDPPTEAEVRARCRELGVETDIAAFLAYNNAAGWKLAWQYALDRWLAKDAEKDKPAAPPGRKTRSGQHFGAERTVDYDEIERRLIAKQRSVRGVSA